MIAMVEGAKRGKTPNEIALSILLAMLTLVFLLATATLAPFSQFAVDAAGQGSVVTLTVLVALLVCLIPTTIGGAAVGDRHRRHGSHGAGQRHRDVGPRRRSGRRRRRAAARQDRHDHARRPAGGRRSSGAGRRRAASSPTPRSSPRWPTRRRKGARSSCWRSRSFSCAAATSRRTPHSFHKFSAQTRMSGVDLEGRQLRKGAADAIRKFVEEQGGAWPAQVSESVDTIARAGRDAARRRRRQRACSASSNCATSSRAASASASPSCGRWASRPSWSPATTASRPRRSPPRRASTTSSPKRRPRRSSR